ncbi:hypothetical protein NQT72_19305 [Pseudoalteromonas carrageenovora]|uniref:hypothetical protein n=1 Tax=Pseudoalteromonas carrageenovora TaxID=227 RepID=UPI002118C14A|nr:hypothetical protein [Pseudoalteromonas carrageenovora]MCQ8891637.1 hypothetical protein [Pseudoalteromonas carrageenovora]
MILLFPLLSQGDDIKRQLSSLISEISNWQNLAPRSAIQLADRLLTSIELIGEEKTVDILVLLVLLCLYMFNKPQYDYMCSIFDEQRFEINPRVTDLKLSSKQLNLPKYLKEMLFAAEKLDGINQLLKLESYEKASLMNLKINFSDIDLLTYFLSFQSVLNRSDKAIKPGYMHTFGYDGRGAIHDYQLLEAQMTFFGLSSFTANDYLNLIGLTSKFADS